MKSFLQHTLAEEETLRQKMGNGYRGGLGDCFEAAFHWALTLDEGEYKTSKVCQGMVHGQGPLEGKLFSHGWGESGGKVYDYSNKKKLVISKKEYYELGKIDESSVYRYPIIKAFGKAVKIGHYGPWDFKGDTEDITEELPLDVKKEIGKRKVKVSRNILKLL
jgi:hypothetical protein